MSKEKLSPQKEIIVSILRDMKFHCSSEFGYIKDDRRRITELNRGYMLEKGFRIVGRPCDGRCGKIHSSGLFMRRAERIYNSLSPYDKLQLLKKATPAQTLQMI